VTELTDQKRIELFTKCMAKPNVLGIGNLVGWVADILAADPATLAGDAVINGILAAVHKDGCWGFLTPEQRKQQQANQFKADHTGKTPNDPKPPGAGPGGFRP